MWLKKIQAAAVDAGLDIGIPAKVILLLETLESIIQEIIFHE
jgi:hypothetical protein